MKTAAFLLLLLPAALIGSIIAYVGWAAPLYRRRRRYRHTLDALDHKNWF